MYEIYSKPGCPACLNAKNLLTKKNLPFSEYILDVGQEQIPGGSYYTVSELQMKVPGVKSVPQIFKDGTLVGGFDKLQQSLS